MKILVIVGGISKHSLNRKTFEAMKKLCPPQVELSTFEISTLPFFSQDLEESLPLEVVNFKNKIKESDAVLFITPEYNRSMPGVLKNALDWGSRPMGQNSWNQKPGAVMGASAGNTGTALAQHHLRQVLTALNMRVMAQPEFFFNGSKAFDENGILINPETIKFMNKYWDSLIPHINLVLGRP